MTQGRVLIVEDEGLIAHKIADSLESLGHEISGIAATGEDAMALLNQSVPDLILMDIRLKGGQDGIDVALKIRLDYDVPVVFLTSYSDIDTMTRARQAKPYGYLTKPFQKPTLASTIVMALGRHRADQALAVREGWLATSLFATATPTLVTDADGRILSLSGSAERLLDCSLAQVEGATWTTAALLVDANTGVELQDLLANALSGGGPCPLPMDTMLRRRDGSRVPIEGEIAPRESCGKMAGAVITLRDITARIEEERFRRQEDKMHAVGQLARGVAVEFDEHLTAIREYGEVLEDRIDSSEDQERLRAILDTTEKAGEIIERLQRLSGALVLSAGSVDVNAAVMRNIELVEPDEKSAIIVSKALDPEAGTIRMESKDFDTIMLHLLVNAFEAMPGGGTVTVTTEVVDGAVGGGAQPRDARRYVRITVRDSGTGLSRDAQDHLFEPYFTTKKPCEGAGLGLSIVHAIVAGAGGTIVVNSTPGVGAQFQFYVPAMEHQPALPRMELLLGQQVPEVLSLK